MLRVSDVFEMESVIILLKNTHYEIETVLMILIMLNISLFLSSESVPSPFQRGDKKGLKDV